MGQHFAAEAQVLRWSVAAISTVELPVLSERFVNLSAKGRGQPSRALHGWANMRLGQLDGWLARCQFIVT